MLLELKRREEIRREESQHRALVEKITETYRSSRQCLQLFEGRRGAEVSKHKAVRDSKMDEKKGEVVVKSLLEARGKVQEKIRERRRDIDSTYDAMVEEAVASAESMLLSRRQKAVRQTQVAFKKAEKRATELLEAKSKEVGAAEIAESEVGEVKDEEEDKEEGVCGRWHPTNRGRGFSKSRARSCEQILAGR